MAVFVASAIIIFVLVYNNTIDKEKFIADNEKYFELIREDDYTFLVYAKYGEDVDPDKLFRSRVLYAFVTGVAFLFVFLSQLSALNIVLTVVIAVLVYKMPYKQLQRAYKAHFRSYKLYTLLFLHQGRL